MDGWDLMAQADRVKAAVRSAPVSGHKKQMFDSGYGGTQNHAASQARVEQERKSREQLEAAQVYADFVHTFNTASAPPPPPPFPGMKPSIFSATPTPPPSTEKKRGSQSSRGKKPREIDAFLEEMKRKQIEEEDRDRNRPPGEPVPVSESSLDSGTTNIYIKNLSPEVTEPMLMEHFGQYGDIASIKVMWPRTEEEKTRASNRGFVSFMTKDGADAAMDAMQDAKIGNLYVKLGWGKAVAIPATPLYSRNGSSQGSAAVAHGSVAIPANAPRFEVKFPKDKAAMRLIDILASYVSKHGHVFEKLVMEKELKNAKFSFMFQVQSPDHIYYRWRTYSLSQGDQIEQWRTDPYQIITGGPFWLPPPEEREDKHDKEDSRDHSPARDDHRREKDRDRDRERDKDDHREKDRDREKERDREKDKESRGEERDDKDKEKGGNSRSDREREREWRRGKLRARDADTFTDMLRELTTDRQLIKQGMGFALDHADESKDIVEILTDSLCLEETPVSKKLARLFLVSDILYNSSAPVRNASSYRSLFQANLVRIFESLHTSFVAIQGRMTANNMKEKVDIILNVWQAWSLFPANLVSKLEQIFVGDTQKQATKVVQPDIAPDDIDGAPIVSSAYGATSDDEADVDGVPMSSGGVLSVFANDGDLDGSPIHSDNDLDGVPMSSTTNDDEDLDGTAL